MFKESMPQKELSGRSQTSSNQVFLNRKPFSTHFSAFPVVDSASSTLKSNLLSSQ